MIVRYHSASICISMGVRIRVSSLRQCMAYVRPILRQSDKLFILYCRRKPQQLLESEFG
jgi:hypothetical protein